MRSVSRLFCTLQRQKSAEKCTQIDRPRQNYCLAVAANTTQHITERILLTLTGSGGSSRGKSNTCKDFPWGVKNPDSKRTQRHVQPSKLHPKWCTQMLPSLKQRRTKSCVTVDAKLFATIFQRIFKYSDIRYTSLTLDKQLNSLIYTPCLKKLCKFVFVRTSSNIHQFWYYLAER